jgi:transposase InsO family protein
VSPRAGIGPGANVGPRLGSGRTLRCSSGSPRIHAELQGQGVRCSRTRVARLIRVVGVSGCHRRRFFTIRGDPKWPSAPDLVERVERAFAASAPNPVWVADLTYVLTRQGFLLLAVVLDACSCCIVGWSMAAHLRTELVVAALDMALQHRCPATGVIHHSDHGSQYTAATFSSVASAQASAPRCGQEAIAMTMCWPRASLPPWSVSFSPAAFERRVPQIPVVA